MQLPQSCLRPLLAQTFQSLAPFVPTTALPHGHTVSMPTFKGNITSNILPTSPSRLVCLNLRRMACDRSGICNSRSQNKAKEQTIACHLRSTPCTVLSSVSLIYVEFVGPQQPNGEMAQWGNMPQRGNMAQRGNGPKGKVWVHTRK